MPRRFLASVALAAAALLAMTSTVFAHECFIANRSDQGNEMATQSSRWVSVSVADFANSPGFPPGVDPECFLEYWSGHGGPATFTVRSDKTIGDHSQNPNLGDGKGVDHIEAAFGPLLGAGLEACAE